MSDPCQSILDNRTSRQTGFSYKLAGADYALDMVVGDMLQVDEKRMSAWLPFADGNRRDGVGDLIEIAGIRTNRHIINPIVLYNHGKVNEGAPIFPVGLTQDRDSKEYTVQLNPIAKIAKANVFFYQGTGIDGVNKDKEYDHAVFCQQLYDLIVKGYVRGGSIGYQTLQAHKIQADYQAGIPEGLHLLETLLLEVSIVYLPANKDTVRKVLAMPQICGKALSPILVKSLSPYLEDGKTSVAVPLTNLPTNKIPPARWKPGVGAIMAIRKKYRPMKSLRRRRQKSRTGISIMGIHEKDLVKARNEAKQIGLKFEQLTNHGGLEKIRVSGDDSSIDRIAKNYAVPLQRGMKNMPKEDRQMEEKTKPADPYGAQVLRRMHEHAGILMQEYDELMGPLEKDQVRSLLEKKLTYLDEYMTEIETLFAEAYEDLKLDAEDLDDATEDKDLEGEEETGEEETQEANTDVVPDDSGHPEVPDADEAVAALKEDPDPDDDTKSLSKKSTKDLRKHYRKKAIEGHSTEESAKCMEDPYAGQTGPCPDEKKPHSRHKEGEKSEPVADPAVDPVEGMEDKGFAEHELSKIGEASGFLKELSTTQEYGEEHRMKSYHFHKTLDPMGAMGDDPMADPAVEDAAADMPDETGMDEEMQGKSATCGKSAVSEHRKYIGQASALFKELSSTQEFSDDHRQKCMKMYKMLDPINGGSPEATEEEAPPVGEVDMKDLAYTIMERQTYLDMLGKKLEALAAL